jgi:hypothetical protein
MYMRSSWFIRILGGIAALGLVGSACTPPPGPPGTPDQLIEIYGLIGNEIYASPPVSLPGTIPYSPFGGVWEVDGSVVTTTDANRFDITAQLVVPLSSATVTLRWQSDLACVRPAANGWCPATGTFLETYTQSSPGFPPDVLVGDTELTGALFFAGGRARFTGEAVGTFGGSPIQTDVLLDVVDNG